MTQWAVVLDGFRTEVVAVKACNECFLARNLHIDIAITYQLEE